LVLKAAVYCRISDDRVGAGLGVARQETDCRERAARLGWQVVGVYVDNDLSAYSGKPRPDYLRMLSDLREGRIDAVLAWHTDRLHRSPRELEEFIDVCERRRVLVETVKAGPVDLSTPAGRAVARTLGAWARYESEHKAERNKRKALELAQAGQLSGGGSRPYGFNEDRVTIREAEAVVIREAMRRVLAGERIRAVARDFNGRGIPTSTGKSWTAQTLKRMLVSGRLSGQRDHQPRSRGQTRRKIAGDIVSDAQWPGIISKVETAKLRALLLDPARRLTNIVPRRCLLTGILRCSLCGGGLSGRPRDDGVMRYVCAKVPGNNRCGKIYVLAEPADDLVSDMVRVALDSPALHDLARLNRAQGEEDEWHLAEMSAAQGKLEQLADDYAQDLITRAEWLTARKRLEVRLEASRGQIAAGAQSMALEGLRGDSEAFLREWLGRSPEQRRAAIRAVLDRVVVHPAVRGRNRFDRDRFEPVWRV
jgi:DNA invertase Pin-like site-specific DNA recombinase